MGNPLPYARKPGSRKNSGERIDEAVKVALRRSSNDGCRPKRFQWGDKTVTVTATRLDQVPQEEIAATVARVLEELGKNT